MDQRKKIPAYRIQHQYRFNKAEINEWILKNKINVSHKLLDLNLTPMPVSIIDLLKKGGIFYRIPGHDVHEVIRNAVKIMPTPPEISKDAVYSLLIDREEMMPTAVGKGIAIPHPRNIIIADIENESVSICFLDGKIDFQAIDNEPVTTLFVVLSANPRRHLEILSKITYLCQQDEFINLLKKQENKEIIQEFIETKEKVWKKR